jgi:hypothetical protein
MSDRERADRVGRVGRGTRRTTVPIEHDVRIVDPGEIVVGGVGRRPRRPHVLLIRPDDLLILNLSWVGMSLRKSGGKADLVRLPGKSFLIVEFPPQHLLEEAYFQEKAANALEATQNPSHPTAPLASEDAGENPLAPPIPAVIANPSRLVFSVPAGFGAIPFTIEGFLEAMTRLPLAVTPNALPNQRPFFLPTVSADALTAIASAFPNSTLFERIVHAARLRTAARGTNPFVGEAVAHLSEILDAHVAVESASRLRGTLEVAEANPILSAGLSDVIVGLRRVRPRPAPPGDLHTAIESPYRLIISPSSLGAWAHASGTIEHNNRVELWHTRLGVRAEDGEGRPIVDERTAWQRIVRAIWARGANQDPANWPAAYAQTTPPVTGVIPFRPSLDDYDRHNIVHLSSNWGITSQQGRYRPDVVDVERLMLTSMGSWMRTAGRWDPPPVLSVEEWIHRATFGRDHFVRVVYRGYLMPFGHRASLIKVTERKFHPDKPGNPAYLRQRMYIVVKEPEKTFGSLSWKYDSGRSAVRGMPFRSVRILNLQTPDLSDPAQNDVDGQAKAFWPHVAGSPFLFKIEATDLEGNVTHFAMPMLWYDQTRQVNQAPFQTIVTGYNQANEIAGIANRVSMGGQRIAFASSKSADDTIFETAAATFEVRIPDGTFNSLPDSQPRFHPIIAGTEVVIPAVRQLAGNPDPASVTYADAYLLHDLGTASNQGELLFWSAPSAPTVSVSFSSQGDRSGGLATPNLKITGISRLTGPVSGTDQTKLAAGTFNPADFFAGLNAKLFGVIDLGDVLEELPFFDDLAKIPGFVSKQLNQVEALLDDLEQLRQAISDLGAAAAGVEVAAEALAIAIATRLQGQPEDVASAITNLSAQLAGFEAALDGLGLAPLLVKRIKSLVSRIRSALGAVATLVSLIESLLSGIELPRALRTRFEWSPDLGPWPNAAEPIFDPHRPLMLAVEAAASIDTGTAELSVLASLEDFDLRLINPAEFLVLHFERLEFRLTAGEKPEIDVVLDDIEFVGVLSFVEVLKDLIPLDGFSDPPSVDVDASGITASYTLGLPNVSVGVFALENMSIGAGFTIPFIGDPLSVWFAFCEKENPALVSVSLFAGGFFFKVTLDPSGVKILEAAIEFGANVSMNFGVASGGVSVMAGIYFKLENDEATLAGYFRVRGHVRALGIVGVSIELYLELSYEFSSGKAVGRASLSISIELFLFEATITISCEKKFAGSGADPTFAQTFAPYELTSGDPTTLVDPWEEYCAAYA